MLVITGAGDIFCAGRPQGPAGPLRPSDGLHSPLRGQRPGGVAGALADALALVFIHRSKDVADPLSSYVSGATIAVTGGKPML